MKKKKYFIYARSAVKPIKGEYSNTNTQVQRLKGFAEHFEMEIVDVIKDYGSGMSSSRPGLMKLLRRLKKDHAQGILCTRWDRLSRDCILYMQLRDMFERDDIEVITLDEDDEDLNGFMYTLYMRKSTEDWY